MRRTWLQTKRKGFTLAELLVVVAIAGILLAIALPALTGLAGQTRLDGAANAVHAAATLARQHAVAHRQPTYLVFHDAHSTDDETLAYRAYAVFTIDTQTQPVTQASGEFLTGWETLPAGVVFDDAVGGSTNLFQVSAGAAWNGALGKNNELKIGNNIHIVQGFKPNGEAGSNTHWIFLAEGFHGDGRLVRTSRQGRQIRFEITGKSMIVDHLYPDAARPTEPRD